MSTVERRHTGTLVRRVVPAALVFLVTTGAIYAASWVALALLRHVVMPIVAVAVGGYLAWHVFRWGGHRD